MVYGIAGQKKIIARLTLSRVGNISGFSKVSYYLPVKIQSNSLNVRTILGSIEERLSVLVRA